MDKCMTCPYKTGYVDLGGCPVCGEPIRMDIKTHVAKCTVCGGEFAVPLGVHRLCTEDMRNRPYTVTIHTMPTKQEILRLGKILGYNVSRLYPLFKGGLPVVLDNVSMMSAYTIMGEKGICVQIYPSAQEYSLFAQCHKERL